ncbi:MAG: Arm DNA-binding domain-containing protein [Acidimicrobiia bacterium]
MVYDIGRDPNTGRRRQRWQGGYATKRDAERALVDVLGRLDIGSSVEPTKQTVSDFLRDEWLPTVSRSSSRSRGDGPAPVDRRS